MYISYKVNLLLFTFLYLFIYIFYIKHIHFIISCNNYNCMYINIFIQIAFSSQRQSVNTPLYTYTLSYKYTHVFYYSYTSLLSTIQIHKKNVSYYIFNVENYSTSISSTTTILFVRHFNLHAHIFIIYKLSHTTFNLV